MKIIHDDHGMAAGPFHALSARLQMAEDSSLEALVREGVILTDEGEPMPESVQKRLRNRLLGTYGERFTTLDDHYTRIEQGFRRHRRERRMLIPGLWSWGEFPMLGGNPKAGKTIVVLDLTRALVVPDYRFLDHFEPSTLTEDELDRGGVVLINAETPAGAFEDELGLEYVDDTSPRGDVMIEHLEELGGAHVMDVTVPAIYDMWLQRLSWCGRCDGSDERVPAVVIVDGVTAILLAAGKPIEAVGLWFAAFRRLMRELGVPNALVTGHNTLQGSHLMGGVEAQAGPDGLWTYSSDNADNPRSTRRFSVRPRAGGIMVPPNQVALDETGRPVIGTAAGAEPPVAAASGANVDELAQKTAEYVLHFPGADGQRLSDHISPESKPMSLKGRARAVELGLIREEKCSPECALCERPHHRRLHYWPASPVQ